MSEQRERANSLRGERAMAVADGRCIKCLKANALPGLQFCLACREAGIAARTRKFNGRVPLRDRRKLGLCEACATPLAATSTKWCATHLERHRKYAKRSHDKRAAEKRAEAVRAVAAVAERTLPPARTPRLGLGAGALALLVAVIVALVAVAR